MAESELARKLKLKPGVRAAVIGAPEGYLTELEPLPQGANLGTRLQGAFDWVQVFVNSTWSAFALRPYRPGEPRQKSWQAPQA